MFGICLGHQMLGLAVGAQTLKMPQGHHGANHPVKDFTTDKVEIVSMNHGFAVDPATLPANARQTHVSLFDGSNCGIALTDRPAFSVQYHPEASPGPRDSHYLFRRFVATMAEAEGRFSALARPPSARMKSTQAASCEIAMNSSGLCAWSIEPGPQTTVGRPAAWKCPASVAKETAFSVFERVSLQRQRRGGVVGLRGERRHVDLHDRLDRRPADEAGQARQRDVVDEGLDLAPPPRPSSTPGRPRNSQWKSHSRARMLRAVPPWITPTCSVE